MHLPEKAANTVFGRSYGSNVCGDYGSGDDVIPFRGATGNAG